MEETSEKRLLKNAEKTNNVIWESLKASAVWLQVEVWPCLSRTTLKHSILVNGVSNQLSQHGLTSQLHVLQGWAYPGFFPGGFLSSIFLFPCPPQTSWLWCSQIQQKNHIFPQRKFTPVASCGQEPIWDVFQGLRAVIKVWGWINKR